MDSDLTFKREPAQCAQAHKVRFVNAEGKAAPHRVHKAKVILEALQGAETVNELTFEHDLNPNLVKN